MSNIGISAPYPSDEYIVDQQHQGVDKDFYEAVLANHDFFGFGQNHQTGGDFVVHDVVELAESATITASKTFVNAVDITVTLPVPERSGQALAVISRNDAGSFILAAPEGHTIEGEANTLVYAREIFSLACVGTDWRLSD